MIARFRETKQSVEEMYQMMEKYAKSKDETLMVKVTELYHRVLEEI